MSKKAIIISLVSVFVVAGGAIGILMWVRGHATPVTPAVAFNNTPTTPVVTTPDLSKDFGACTVLSKSTIESTLGKPAANLQGPDNMGLGHEGNGDEAQTCVYSFITGGTMSNGFNLSDGFSVNVYEFANQANLTADQSAKVDGSVAISGVGDQAVFIPTVDTVAKQNEYNLKVYSGLKYYDYKISEPSGAASFTSDTAQAALLALAKSVTY